MRSHEELLYICKAIRQAFAGSQKIIADNVSRLSMKWTRGQSVECFTEYVNHRSADAALVHPADVSISVDGIELTRYIDAEIYIENDWIPVMLIGDPEDSLVVAGQAPEMKFTVTLESDAYSGGANTVKRFSIAMTSDTESVVIEFSAKVIEIQQLRSVGEIYAYAIELAIIPEDGGISVAI